MKETYQFRIPPGYRDIVLGSDGELDNDPDLKAEDWLAEGVVGDLLYRKIEKADRHLAMNGEKSFIVGWDSRYNRRLYTEEEVESGHLFLIEVWYASGAGEEFGTWYTSVAFDGDCAFEREKKAYGATEAVGCGLSSRQVGPLRFPFRK